MTPPPANPKIYHITHIDNLRGIAMSGGLHSDARIAEQGGPSCSIGMSGIKRRRIEELTVTCHSDTKVGEYVPFYFCPRSVMLFVIYRANHPELTYKGGQDAIIHLEADLLEVVRWCDTKGVRWAFSLSNAGARYTEFRSDLNALIELDWEAIMARDFRDPDIKERKQAEFLVHDFFPFDLIKRIGVRIESTRSLARQALVGTKYAPPVEIRTEWYF